MLYLLLTLLSCSALKLSDPVALRDVTDENVSLKAWCAGAGCVMPFTPASCLSWCDWNFDKQADAEARGAFASRDWGDKKQKKATDFSLIFGKSCNTADQVPFYFMNAAKALNVDKKTYLNSFEPIFPGGDDEKKLGDTLLECKRCYPMQSMLAKDDDPIFNEFSVSFSKSDISAAPSKLQIFKYDAEKKCSGTLLYSFDLGPFDHGKNIKGKWVSATTAMGGKCFLAGMFDPIVDAKYKEEVKKCLAKKDQTDLDKKEADAKTVYDKDKTNATNKGAWEDAVKATADKLAACTKVWTDANDLFADGTRPIGFGLNRLAWPTCA